jgi:hypothetical protein
MTTTKRLLLIAALLLIVAAVILGVLSLLPPDPGVTKANFDRIEKGMTQAEVQEMFGGKGIFLERSDPPYYCWQADDGSWANILFSDDCVTDKLWRDSGETFLDTIRRWLHLR